MKIIAIIPYPYDTVPGQRFRIEQWARYLKDTENINIDFISFLGKKTYNRFCKDKIFFVELFRLLIAYFKMMIRILFLGKPVVVFLYREATLFGPPIPEFILKLRKIPIIYDFDDAIFRQPNLKSFKEKTAYYFRFPLHLKMRYLCRISEHVVAGNKYLRNFATRYNKNVSVVPTSIDTKRYKIKDYICKDKVTIGWTGSRTTASQHLVPFVPVLKKLKEKSDFHFIEICDTEINIDIDYQFIRWNPIAETEALHNLDIGIMPLPDDKWAEGKCALKMLQYMAVGVAAVASPVGINKEVISNGRDGFLASTEEEWADRLSFLVNNPKVRRNIGLAGRTTVEEKYSVKVSAPKILRIIKMCAT